MVSCDVWLDTADGCHTHTKKVLYFLQLQKEGDKDIFFLMAVKCKRPLKATWLKTKKDQKRNPTKPKLSKFMCISVVCVTNASVQGGRMGNLQERCRQHS